MRERLFVIASKRERGKTWWVVGEKAGPRSAKHVAIWTFRTRAEAIHLIEALGRLVEDLGRFALVVTQGTAPLACARCAAESQLQIPADP